MLLLAFQTIVWDRMCDDLIKSTQNRTNNDTVNDWKKANMPK